MSSLKVPIIIGVIGFVLIFIINLIVGNTFLVSIARSFFYGFTVFGITYGIAFVFKNYLGIDLEFNKINDKDDESIVDIVVGNEDNDEHKEIEDADESETQYQYSPDMNDAEGVEGDNAKKDFSEESNFDSSEFDLKYNNENKESSKEPNEYEAEIDSDNEVLESVNDKEEIEDVVGAESDESESLDRLSDLSYDSERVEDDNYSTEDENSEMSSEALKKKIGVDVSFEDVAKAIRTKLKSNE